MNKEGGVFANLIPKMEGLRDLGAKPDPARAEIPAAHTDSAEDANEDDFFFEFDEPGEEPETPGTLPGSEADRVSAAHPIASVQDISQERPAARKINYDDIPAGHVKLEDPHRSSAPFSGFDESDPHDLVGRIVKGRYVIVEFLGGDENGLAYLADDRLVEERKVLVRIITEDQTDDMMESILAEERVSLSHFSHPSVARLIDSGQFTNGTKFLVSEYVDALSVRDILEIHGHFQEQRAARVIRQVASALSEANQQGILHRDIRPENVIVDTTGETEQVKLVNFGASNGEPNRVNMPYKAPEVLDGRANTVVSDVYSLAVVAFEMLTGRRPFDGTTNKEVMRAQSDGPTQLPSELREQLPTAVDNVLRKALSFRPASRYTRARDFGEALVEALSAARSEARRGSTHEATLELPAEAAAEPIVTPAAEPAKTRATSSGKSVTLQPEMAKRPAEPAWKQRSPEPPAEATSRGGVFAGIGILALLLLVALGWYYIAKQPSGEQLPQGGSLPANSQPSTPTLSSDTEMPPQPRSIAQPPNSNFYENTKQNLRGDLLMNFVGFTLYYPKDWKVNGPEAGAANTRGNFLDISRVDQAGHMREQMLISYYPSKGTYSADTAAFPALVKESNDTLKKLLPGYQAISEGEIKVNGDWRAYELKFQAGGTSADGDKLNVWGRRLFIPASRPGVRDGFMITMLATSYSDDVHSVDDVGVKGELAPILYSFEPSQNF